MATYNYQIQRSADGVTWTNITGASGSFDGVSPFTRDLQYVIQSADANDYLRCKVTDSVGNVKYSGPVGPVGSVVTPPPLSSDTFESSSAWARPSPATPSEASAMGWRMRAFHDASTLSSYISGLAAHDYVYYDGNGNMPIVSGATDVLTIANKNLSSPAVIDFGTAKSVWAPQYVSTNYVTLNSSNTGQGACIYLHDLTNVRIFGGLLTTTPYGGSGLLAFTPMTNCYFMDWYANSIGGGNEFHGNNISGSPAAYNTVWIRGEANRWCLNPAHDSHNASYGPGEETGAGIHGLMLHGGGAYLNVNAAIYAHDSLQPGEVSAGKTWPDGGGASVIELGQNGATGDSYNNLNIWAKGERLKGTPRGLNPNSSGPQPMGQILEFWGSTPMNNTKIQWVEGNDITGTLCHCAGGSWHNATPPIQVLHGRHSNVNQFTGDGNGAPNNVPYPSGFGLVYSADCL